MKAERKLSGRPTLAVSEVMQERSTLKSASIGETYGDQTDEFDVDFAVDDKGLLDEPDSDLSAWCDAQDVARELAGRAWS